MSVNHVIQPGIQLVGIPMPPSQNKQLMVCRGRMIKTKDARQFDNAFDVYALIRKRGLEASVNRINEWLTVDGFNSLRVDLEFFFPREKLWTKKNTIKRLDTGNRMKAVLDKLSMALGVDDSLFIESYIKKTVGDKESVVASIFPMNF